MAKVALKLRRSAADFQMDKYLVGGVNSPVRSFRQVEAAQLIAARSRGACLWDAQGRRYLDFIMGWGALILGHNPVEVTTALRQRLKQGILLGLTHETEVSLAQAITESVPSVEQVRFAASGTEACMTAVKIARAHTRKNKILAFDGCYHGHGESLIAAASAGLPRFSSDELISVAFNDPAAFDAAFDSHRADLACVIIEPAAANMGVVAPQPGFLAHIRERTAEAGVVLIFDEVVTGFRLGLGGAQGLFGLSAELTTFGKIIGGGLPIGAVGGPRQLMQHLAPQGAVYHGGTFAGHPLAMAAGLATLKRLKENPPYERIEHLAEEASERLALAAKKEGVAVAVNRVASLFTVFFSERPVRDKASAKSSRRDLFAVWANHLRQSGVLVPPSPYEALFIGSAHSAKHVDALVKASQKAFRQMSRLQKNDGKSAQI